MTSGPQRAIDRHRPRPPVRCFRAVPCVPALSAVSSGVVWCCPGTHRWLAVSDGLSQIWLGSYVLFVVDVLSCDVVG